MWRRVAAYRTHVFQTEVPKSASTNVELIMQSGTNTSFLQDVQEGVKYVLRTDVVYELEK